MATTNFSSLSGSTNLTFNPGTDILFFDSSEIQPISVLMLSSFSGGTTFSYNGVSVTLTGIHATSLTPDNVVFANGGKLLIGDQSTDTANDINNGFTFDGSSQADVFYGFNGTDTFNGGDGNDRFFLVSAPSSSPDIANGGNGSDRVIFLGASTSTGGLQGTTQNVNIDLSQSQATWGASLVQLNSIEEVQVIAGNGTSHNLQGGASNDIFIVGGVQGTASASYTVNGGEGWDWLVFNTLNPTELMINLSNNSTIWGNSQVLFSNIEAVGGGAGNDNITGNSSNNAIFGRGGNDTVHGGDGIDFAHYALNASNYAINKTSTGYTVSANTGSEGVDTLTSIERIQFADKRIALDLSPNGNAGQAMAFIGVIAPSLLDAPNIRGLIVSLFDQGYSMLDLSQLALDLDLIPKTSSVDLANAAFRNVTGLDKPDDSLTSVLVNYIEQHGQADFLATVAGLQINVDLVGLQQSGIEYVL